ncbi:NlpC/P60 family protein [Streptomyces sp. NBC_01237]|uniref:NlpC/P60 family protein n=1 Tax=Streptomyces sp. NBC_01237 TaxID=2903790 RepID=UPI002DD7C17A|nr:NlpC/P60 family protein [Streptomyces sp. NBC_01237]WRZ78752.1 C40 family peptidase [Streptomyces sp. NBC_01237]
MEGRAALQTATTVFGRAATLKASGAAALLFIVFLLIVGLIGASGAGQASADSCGRRGSPGAELGDLGDDSAQTPGAQTRKNQKENALIIDSVAQTKGLSGRATLIALMTALQESTLLNLPYGHLDSIGLFQQRPSMGWGSRKQIMQPRYAASMFFYGAEDGDPPGLTDVPGWETKSVRALILEVQRPDVATIELYMGQESAAREIAQHAGINLDRTGEGHTAEIDTPQGNQGPPGSSGECYPDNAQNQGKPGNPFYDGNSSWPKVVKNPRSAEEAIAWARRESRTGGKKWFRLCLKFVAIAYGWNQSGVRYAVDNYKNMPEGMKHSKDRNPSPGALMYWETGHPAGHVAIYIGNGKVVSNDIRRPGYIDVADATEFETKWGSTYLGWAPPYFPNGG